MRMTAHDLYFDSLFIYNHAVRGRGKWREFCSNHSCLCTQSLALV